MGMKYGKFRKKASTAKYSAKKQPFGSTAPLTVLVSSPNKDDKTRIGTGHIFQSGKYAGEGFKIECDRDERAEKLWFEMRREFKILSNKKFNNDSGPVTVLIEDPENKSKLTPIGKGYYKDKKVEIECYYDERAEQLWFEQRHKFLVLPDRR